MQRTGRSANIARSPSSECASPDLNWTELQQGHARRNHSIRGSQFGQIVLAATFSLNVLPIINAISNAQFHPLSWGFLPAM